MATHILMKFGEDQMEMPERTYVTDGQTDGQNGAQQYVFNTTMSWET